MRVVSAGLVGGDFDDLRVGHDEDAVGGLGAYGGEAGESTEGGKNGELGSEVKAGEAQAGAGRSAKPRAGVDVAAEHVRAVGGRRVVAGKEWSEAHAVVQKFEAEVFEVAPCAPVMVAGHTGKADVRHGGALPRTEAFEDGTVGHARSVEGVAEENDGLHRMEAEDCGEAPPFAMIGGGGQHDSVAREKGRSSEMQVGGKEDAPRGPEEGTLGQGEETLTRKADL